MIDQFFRGIAKEIHNVMSPEIKQFLTDLFQNNIFQKMTPEEMQITIIKVVLEVLAVMLLIWISNRKHRSKKRKKEKSSPKSNSTKKTFKPKKWNTDGSYYDEEKKKWIDPDFK